MNIGWFGGRVLAVTFSFLAAGCAFDDFKTQAAPRPSGLRQVEAPKKLLVFLDGTANEWDTRTNVRRLFEMAAAREDPRTLCFYCEGVGVHSLLGQAFGLGMRKRAELAYQFLSNNYEPGDSIYVFGFSRGAHMTRFLSGLISFCGLMDPQAKDPQKRRGIERISEIFEFCDRIEDDVESATDFERVRTQAIASLADRDIVCRPVPIRFLGIWDTVPGSQFKQFARDREKSDDGVVGTRYKMRAYPAIQEVVHGLSLDEKRSEFKPVWMGDAIDPGATRIQEVWFPGAHSDVGGGYEDSNDMAGLALNWMLQALDGHGIVDGVRVYADPRGIQHHPESVKLSSIGSEAVDREVPANALLHWSFFERLAPGPVPHRFGSLKYRQLEYRPHWRGASWNPGARPSTAELSAYRKLEKAGK